MGKSPFTMPGSQFLGKGNQSVAPGKYTESPMKEEGTTEEKKLALSYWEKHKDDPNYQEYLASKMGGPTTFEGGKSTTIKPAPGKMKGSPYKLTTESGGTKLKDKFRAFGHALKAGLTATEDFAQTAARTYKRKKKEYRETP